MDGVSFASKRSEATMRPFGIAGGGGGGGRQPPFRRSLNRSRTTTTSTFVAFCALWCFAAKVEAFSAPAPISTRRTESDASSGSPPPPLPLTTIDEGEIRRIQERAESDARARHDDYAFNALFVPLEDEISTPLPCKLNGELPPDLPRGCLLRVGPNGAEGEAFLDGDGMVHCVTLPPPMDVESMMRPTAADAAAAAAAEADTMDIGNGSVDDETGTTTTVPHHSATYVHTRGRSLEARHPSGSTFSGTLFSAPRGWPMLASLVRNAVKFRTNVGQKDTANTALASHGSRVLALMEQSPPSEIEITKGGEVRTVESFSRLDGAVPDDNPITGGAMGAHGRTCPRTGERVHVSYGSTRRPFVRVDTFAAPGTENEADDATNRSGFRLKRSVGVDVPTPVMIHDVAITANYVVLFDLPLTIRPRRIVAGDSFPVEYEPTHPSRLGLLPRNATSDDDVRWFDCDPGVVLHAVNAHENDDGDVVTVHAFRSEPRDEECYILKYAPTFLHEYRLDLTSGTCKERCLNPDVMVEFPAIDERSVGRREAPHVYGVTVRSIGGPSAVHCAPEEGILIDGVVKFALTGAGYGEGGEGGAPVGAGEVVDRYVLPDTWHAVSEPTVVPKVGGGDGDGDGAYVMMMATRVPVRDDDVVGDGEDWRETFRGATESMTSRLLVLDADGLGGGPVCSIDLPTRVPYGLHSMFLPWKDMV